jgi:hypothetical protein
MHKFNKSTGGSFTFPLCLSDITLKHYIDYLIFVEPTKPKELKDIEEISAKYATSEAEEDKLAYDQAFEAMTAVVMYRKIYPFYARVVSHFANDLTEDEILGGKKKGDGMNIGNLQWLYSSIVQMLSNPEVPEYSPVIMVNEELWYLPQKHMEKSKLIEYAEASQFEANLQEVENGNLLALPKIMCVLVRKKEEIYSDKLLKREEMFFNWDLLSCLKVGFFLLRLKETYILNLEAYTAAQDLTNLKLALNS